MGTASPARRETAPPAEDTVYRRPVSVAQQYLDALGLERAEPSLTFLTQMTRRHVSTLAFSSIGPRLRDDLPLGPEHLLDRIVVRGRGGYCFEQNGLLFEVLQELGFDARIQLARVIHNQDVHPGLTHRVTLVTIDGREYVADVGFGPLGPPTPVPMPKDDSVDDGARFRVHEARPGEFHMQSIVDGQRYSLYRFDLARYGPSDCELGHFYSHRHPEATFVNNLVASLILEDEVRSLRNRDYWVIREDSTTTTAITSAEQLRGLLASELGVQVSAAEGQRLFDELPPG
jgi:N-hydroxyarylamine O-acetyltransferase